MIYIIIIIQLILIGWLIYSKSTIYKKYREIRYKHLTFELLEHQNLFFEKVIKNTEMLFGENVMYMLFKLSDEDRKSDSKSDS